MTSPVTLLSSLASCGTACDASSGKRCSTERRALLHLSYSYAPPCGPALRALLTALSLLRRADSGHAPALPSSAMKSRRLIGPHMRVARRLAQCLRIDEAGLTQGMLLLCGISDQHLQIKFSWKKVGCLISPFLDQKKTRARSHIATHHENRYRNTPQEPLLSNIRNSELRGGFRNEGYSDTKSPQCPYAIFLHCSRHELSHSAEDAAPSSASIRELRHDKAGSCVDRRRQRWCRQDNGCSHTA